MPSSTALIKYCFKITLTDENGNEKIIVSDGTEKYRPSHIVRESLYLNETVDGRLYEEDVHLTDYDDSEWLSPVEKEAPNTVLDKQDFPGDKIKYSLPFLCSIFSN